LTQNLEIIYRHSRRPKQLSLFGQWPPPDPDLVGSPILANFLLFWRRYRYVTNPFRVIRWRRGGNSLTLQGLSLNLAIGDCRVGASWIVAIFLTSRPIAANTARRWIQNHHYGVFADISQHLPVTISIPRMTTFTFIFAISHCGRVKDKATFREYDLICS
jgi:hypothetical protein